MKKIIEITRYNPIAKKDITTYYTKSSLGYVDIIPKQDLEYFIANGYVIVKQKSLSEEA